MENADISFTQGDERAVAGPEEGPPRLQVAGVACFPLSQWERSGVGRSLRGCYAVRLQRSLWVLQGDCKRSQRGRSKAASGGSQADAFAHAL